MVAEWRDGSANGRFSGVGFGKGRSTSWGRIVSRRSSGRMKIKTLNSLRTASKAATIEPDLAGVNRSNTASTIFNKLRKATSGEGVATLAGTAIGHVFGGSPITGAVAGMAASRLAKVLAERRAAATMDAMLNPSRSDLIAGPTMAAQQRAAMAAALSRASPGLTTSLVSSIYQRTLNRNVLSLPGFIQRKRKCIRNADKEEVNEGQRDQFHAGRGSVGFESFIIGHLAVPYSHGVFTRVANFVSDAANGVLISSAEMDAEFNGVAAGLSTCVLKDGTQAVTASIRDGRPQVDRAGASATAPGDAIPLGQAVRKNGGFISFQPTIKPAPVGKSKLRHGRRFLMGLPIFAAISFSLR